MQAVFNSKKLLLKSMN